jgi:hypothetical protein
MLEKNQLQKLCLPYYLLALEKHFIIAIYIPLKKMGLVSVCTAPTKTIYNNFSFFLNEFHAPSKLLFPLLSKNPNCLPIPLL